MLGILKKIHSVPNRPATDLLVGDAAQAEMRGLGQACMHGMAGIEWQERFSITRPKHGVTSVDEVPTDEQPRP